MKQKQFPLAASNFSAGIMACFIGYSSSAIIVFQAALKLGLNPLEASSWLGIICFSMGILTILLSYFYKTPIMLAWSTAGAALLIVGLDGVSVSQAYGAFFFSGFLIFIVGVTGIFAKAMNKIPIALAQAMLAGILFKFALGVFQAIETQATLVISLFIFYLILRRFIPRYTILILTVTGFIYCYFLQLINFSLIDFQMAVPHFVTPSFDIKILISIGLPLFIVTMTSQNMAGVATLKAHDYKINISRVIGISGFLNMLIAPFGGFAINLAAITAAICMGEDAHPDKEQRYVAAMVSGFVYIFLGIFAGAIGSFFISLPRELVAVITGLALFGTITQGISQSIKNEFEREAAMITFFITASGISFLGIGSAFWGIIGGTLCFFISRLRHT